MKWRSLRDPVRGGRRASHRLLAAVLVAGMGIVLTRCDSDVFQPSLETGDLTVSPSGFADSAAEGSSARRAMEIRIETTGTGAVEWQAAPMHGSSWLALGTTSGWTPASLAVSLDPAGLITGTYRDVLVVSTGPAGAQVEIPVEFRIHSCAVTVFMLDVDVTDSLRASSCAAPHRPGSSAQLYSFTADAGDSVSVELLADHFDAHLILDTSAAQAPLAESGACQGVPGDPCLRYQFLPRSGSYIIEATSAAPGAAGVFTLRATRPRRPAVIESPGQFRSDTTTALEAGAAIEEPIVVLVAVVEDADAADSVHLEVEVKLVGKAFTGEVAAASTPYPTGMQAAIRLAGLSNGSYHWQGRTRDHTGRTSAWAPYGGNDEDEADFRVAVQQAPALPLQLEQVKANGTPIARGGTTDEETVTFRGTVTDPNAADQLHLEIEIQPLGHAFTNMPSLASPAPPVTSGATAAVAVHGLLDNVSYHWQARAVDQSGMPGLWAAFGDNHEADADFQIALPPAQLVFLEQPSTTRAGATIAPAVRIAAQDASGRTLNSFTSTLAVIIGTNPGPGMLSGTKTVAAVAGVATFADLRISQAADGYTLTASSPGLPDATSAPFSVTAGAVSAAQSTISAVPSEITAGNTSVITVTARDAFGNPIAGVAVSLSSTGLGNILTQPDGLTNAAGIANGQLRSTAPELKMVSASISGLALTQTVAVSVIPGPTTQLVFMTPPSSTTAGALLPAPVQLTAQDDFGNVATAFTGPVTLALGPEPTTATLTGATTVAAIAGVATFADLSVDEAAESYTLTASTAGLPDVVSPTFSVTPAGATRLVFTVAPTSTTAGTPLTPPVEITAQDQFGNTATGYTEPVTLALIPTPTAATLAGPTTATPVAGVVTFSDLRIDRAGDGYSLTATAPGLPDIVSPTFTVSPGSATRLVFTTPPTATTAGELFTPPVRLTAEDDNGNTATSFTGSVAIALGPAPTTAMLGGTTDVPAVAGIVIFADLRVDRAGENYTLTAGAPGIPEVASPVFDVHPGAVSASQSTITAEPTEIPVGSPGTITVIARDAFGNPVAGAAVSLSSTGLGNTLTQPDGLTNAAGIANGQLRSTAPELKMVSASISGLALTQTVAVSVIPGPATQLVFTTPPSSTTAGALLKPPVQLTAQDEFGNTATAFTDPVTLTLGPASTMATLGGTTSLAPVAGVATFADLSITTAGEYYTLTASAPGLSNVVSAPFDVIPGPAARIVLMPAWMALVPGDSLQTTAAAFDAHGNPIVDQYTWETANPGTATVDAAGWVRGIAFGTTTVTARTAQAVGTTPAIVAPPQLVGAGDIATCPSKNDDSTAALLDTLPGVVFTAGDNAYPDGTAANYADCYHPTWGRHRERTRPSPGNHEYHTPGAAPYFAYFGALAGDSGLGYYSFDFADWHIISLNSNIAMTVGSAQEQWLRADLAAHPSQCTLAYWHHPRWSSGHHGSLSKSKSMWQALYDAGADLVLAGHDHTYERFAPQTPAGVADPVTGIRQFVVGMGGAGSYEFLTVEPNSEVRDNTSHGVFVLTLRSSGYDWRFVPVRGDTFTDEGSTECH